MSCSPGAAHRRMWRDPISSPHSSISGCCSSCCRSAFALFPAVRAHRRLGGPGLSRDVCEARRSRRGARGTACGHGAAVVLSRGRTHQDSAACRGTRLDQIEPAGGYLLFGPAPPPRSLLLARRRRESRAAEREGLRQVPQRFGGRAHCAFNQNQSFAGSAAESSRRSSAMPEFTTSITASPFSSLASYPAARVETETRNT